jgi:hypothetical protein
MKSGKLLASLLITTFTLNTVVLAQQQAEQAPVTPPPAAAEDGQQVQPRFIWGLLINVLLSKLGSAAWNVFADWLAKSLKTTVEQRLNLITPVPVDSPWGALKFRSSNALAARGADIVVADPPAPLSVNNGRENYQGAHIALLMVKDDGTPLAFRGVTEGFKSGESFRLRVVSTFDSELVIENINPNGERRQIYPAQRDQVVAIPAGKEVLVPLSRDDRFRFGGTTGREQLIVRLADPRAVAAQASQNRVNRKDVDYGSNFLQEVAPGTYPMIEQSIELQHQAP